MQGKWLGTVIRDRLIKWLQINLQAEKEWVHVLLYFPAEDRWPCLAASFCGEGCYEWFLREGRFFLSLQWVEKDVGKTGLLGSKISAVQ